jgi:superfamily II DNA helicase RecQ
MKNKKKYFLPCYSHLQRQRNNVRRMIAYCENKVDCRRQQILQYFGEEFDPRKCEKTCDNCRSKVNYVSKDVTEDVKDILSLSKSLSCIEWISGIPPKREGHFDSFGGCLSRLKTCQNSESTS